MSTRQMEVSCRESPRAGDGGTQRPWLTSLAVALARHPFAAATLALGFMLRISLSFVYIDTIFDATFD